MGTSRGGGTGGPGGGRPMSAGGAGFASTRGGHKPAFAPPRSFSGGSGGGVAHHAPGHAHTGAHTAQGHGAHAGHVGGQGSHHASAMAKKAFARVKQLAAVADKAEEDDEYYFNELAKNSRHPPRIPHLNEGALFSTQGTAGINFDQYDDIKVERSGTGEEAVPVMRSFMELGESLPTFLSRNIQLMKYDRPTPIQAHAVPVALNKMDLMCCAQTGSGKTCAYLLPLIAALHNGKPRPWHTQFEGRSAVPLALVMAPTRELAVQIHLEAQKLCNRSGLHPLVVYGGAKARQQLYELAQGVDILVATPGRLQDFCDRNLINLTQVRFLVLDEADRMLDMGFEPQIRSLHSIMTPPNERQTLMFSATFPPLVQKLAGEFTRNYIWIGVGRVGSTVASIEQRLVFADNNRFHKLQLLVDAFSSCPGRTLVFVKTKAMATWVARQMRAQARFRNLRTAEIHGDRTQAQREEALQAFRDGHVQVLVATDVAARGLDIVGVTHVINFDLASTPDEFDSYVHRIGRTGRAGNTGIATSFYVPGFDPKSGCGRIAGQLLQLLRETNQVIPDWFLNLPEVRSLGNMNHADHHGTKFGGRDVRNPHSRPKSHPQPHRFPPTQPHPAQHGAAHDGAFPAEAKMHFPPQDNFQRSPPQHPVKGPPPRFSQTQPSGPVRPQDFRNNAGGGFQDPLPPQQHRALLPDPRAHSYGGHQDHNSVASMQSHQPQHPPRIELPARPEPQQQSHHRGHAHQHQHHQHQHSSQQSASHIREFQPGKQWQPSDKPGQQQQQQSGNYIHGNHQQWETPMASYAPFQRPDSRQQNQYPGSQHQQQQHQQHLQQQQQYSHQLHQAHQQHQQHAQQGQHVQQQQQQHVQQQQQQQQHPHTRHVVVTRQQLPQLGQSVQPAQQQQQQQQQPFRPPQVILPQPQDSRAPQRLLPGQQNSSFPQQPQIPGQPLQGGQPQGGRRQNSVARQPLLPQDAAQPVPNRLYPPPVLIPQKDGHVKATNQPPKVQPKSLPNNQDGKPQSPTPPKPHHLQKQPSKPEAVQSAQDQSKKTGQSPASPPKPEPKQPGAHPNGSTTKPRSPQPKGSVQVASPQAQPNPSQSRPLPASPSD